MCEDQRYARLQHQAKELLLAATSSTMLTEAIAAARSGDRTRARELLARMLRADSSNVEYWIWMSAVVDSPRERVYCLESALRLDPTNRAALRGLVILGARQPDEAEVTAALKMPRRKFDFELKPLPQEKVEEITQVAKPEPAPIQPAEAIPWRRVGTGVLGVAGLAVIVFLITKIIPMINSFLGSQPFGRAAQLPALSGTVTLTFEPGTPTLTPVPAATRVMRTPIPTEFARTPLSLLVPATSTATPVLGITPHAFEAYNSGIDELMQGDYEAALTLFDQVIDAEPDHADVHYFRGEALRLMGEFGQAIFAYDKAVTLNEDFVPAYLGRALTFAAREDDKNAILDFDRALKRDPSLARIHEELGAFYAARNQWEKLENEMLRALELDVDTPRIRIYLSESQLFQSKYEEALLNALEGSANDPTMLEGYLAVGRAYASWGVNSFETQYFESALWPLQTYIAYRPDDHRGWGALARTYAGMGEIDQAFDAANQALEINPRFGQAYLARSIVHMERGDYELALDDVTLARRYSSVNFDMLYLTGKANYLNGDFLDAIENVTAATKAADEDPKFVNRQKKQAETYALLALTFETNPETLEDAITYWRWLLTLEHVRTSTWQLAETHLAELTGEGPTRTPTLSPTVTATSAAGTPSGQPTSTITP